ncbi:glycosyltransferase family 4 protein [Sagittula sp. SSi028]|uniref:glycosyltransferase family 4 protein n=1 Tax=Sagittula sp. SSi028 TaxID=3400636 RepID=UPI003AF86AAF
MTDLVLNARFLMRQPTGVDRVATELISAVAKEGLPGQFAALRAVKPAGPIVASDTRPKALHGLIETSTSRLSGHAWEQLALQNIRPHDILLSLCNMGPVLRRRQVVMFHDAQAFRAPESYSRAFRTWYHALQPRLGRRAALVLTVSEHSRRELEHFGIVPPGKTRIVPNGADHVLRSVPDMTILTEHGLAPKKYILVIGSLAPHKNLAMLAEAARRRRDRTLPLVIAGGGNAQVFGEAGITPSEDVRMLGRVSDDALRALYDNACALAFPSRTEGFGLPPAEAMFCGCPVISSTGGAIPEVCGNATLARDPKDLSGWTAAMETVAADSALCQRLSEAGLAQVARFTWQEAAKTLLRNLEESDL